MCVLGNVETWRSKAAYSVAAVLVSSVLASGAALAQDQKTGGPTPSSPGAEVYFFNLKDGAVVSPKLKINFGLRNMGVAPAGSDRDNSGHHHIIVDAETPPLDQPIPNDFNHLHFGAGQTEAEIELKPGEHTLQLLMGDKNHIPHTPPVMSPRIRVRVTEAVARKPAPKDARVYFVGLENGAVIRPEVTLHFGLLKMGVAPAGIDNPNTGHHHLLIDTKLPPLDQPIPNDFNHLHFGAGQTEATVTLPLGKHTLQLLFADENHVPHDPVVTSAAIQVTVTQSEPSARPSSAKRPRRTYYQSYQRNDWVRRNWRYR
jgi:hypothetical protein